MLKLIVPPIAAGGFFDVKIDAGSILPVAVKLADTTFKLEVDDGDLIPESDEANNTTWHNL